MLKQQFVEKVKISIFIFSLSLFGILEKAGAAAPLITETWNSATRDSSTSFNAEHRQLVVFYAKADQDITAWHWLVNGIEQALPEQIYGPAHPQDCSYRIWADSDGVTYVIEAYGSNANGNTGAVQWTITVPSRKGNLAGKVTDTNNSALAGVTITDGLYTAVSDSNGNYSINNMTEKTYALTAHKPGYVWLTNRITITANQTTNQDFQLAAFSTAAITYTGSAIQIANGHATIGLINAAINDVSVLEQISPKVWLLKKNITGTNSTLYLNDEDISELRLLSLNDINAVKVQAPPFLHVFNTKVISWNTNTNAPSADTDTYKSQIQVEGGGTQGTFINANIGYLYLRLVPGKETYIQNSTLDHTNGFIPDGAYKMPYTTAINNILTTGKIRQGPFNIIDGNVVSSKTDETIQGGLVQKNNYVLRAGWSGMITWKYSLNNAVCNAYHNGIELGGNKGNASIGGTIKNCEVFATYDNGIYVSVMDYITPPVQNAIVEDCTIHEINSRGLMIDPGANITVRRLKSWNALSPFQIDNSVNQPDNGNIYLIDSDLSSGITSNKSPNTNVINTNFGGVKWMEESDVTVWYYLDVLVLDKNGYPVKDSTVSLNHPGVSINWYGDSTEFRTVYAQPINLHVIPRANTDGLLAPQNISSSTTGSDGHTPLPSDSDRTLVIPEQRSDRHGIPWFQHPVQKTEFSSWTITAEKYGFFASTTANPDATWYRPKPNVPVKTITITLPFDSRVYGSISGTVTDNTGKPISDASVTTGSNSSTTDVTGNYTLAPVPIGTYTLTASKKGYISTSNQIQVLEGQNTETNFTLKIDNSSFSPYAYPIPYIPGKHALLTFTNINAPSKIEIYTVDGTLIYEKQVNEFSHSFVPDGFSSGVYMYLIKNSKGTSTGKIIIIR